VKGKQMSPALISSNEISSALIKVFWITVGWTVVALFTFFIGYSTIIDSKFQCETAGFDLALYLRSTLIAGVAAGIIGGSVVVFVWEKWLRSKSYGWALTSIFWSYTLVYLLVTLISGLLFHSSLFKQSISDPKLWQYVMNHMFDMEGLINFLHWLFILIATLVILQVNDKYGPGVFASFLLGKYFHPKKEKRIFMFLDLRSCTSIAEKLGERNYFNFLKEVYQHVTPSILSSKGEIYQYVGDEIVISWKINKGIEKANCIRCFFNIQSSLNKNLDYYNKKYGVVPEFKAGLHYGDVMAGEIGVVKREIAFSGDVLNTTSRIESKCNELGVNILLSKFLLDKLNLKPNSFTTQLMGDIELRGKEISLSLYTVTQVGEGNISL
jgi:adenylate cyclase